MIRLNDVLVITPRITPTEARMVIVVSLHGDEPSEPRGHDVRVQGQVVGPVCEYATTLSTRFPVGPEVLPASATFQTAVSILEPCFWEPEHPFCYEVELELYVEDRLVDMRRVSAGVRHLAVDGDELLLNGRAFFVRGVTRSSATTFTELDCWHDVRCDAFLTDASSGLCDRTDRWGPMVFHHFAVESDTVVSQVRRLRNHASLLMWVLPDHGFRDLEPIVEAIRQIDRSRPIGRMVARDESARAVRAVDVLLLPVGHPEIGNLGLRRPYLVVADSVAACTPDRFDEQAAALSDSLGSPPGLIGVLC